MDKYYDATICLNGHTISTTKSNYQKRCTICGEPTVSNCGNCLKPIRGDMKSEFPMLGLEYNRPSYCYECGEPYPWTSRIIDNAFELISLDGELDTNTKTLLKSAIPDLLVDVPATQVAVMKYHTGISKASKVLKDTLYNLLIDVTSETVKKSLFG